MVPTYNAVPVMLLTQRGMIIKKLTKCGAFSEETAVTLEQAEVFKVFPYVIKTMKKKKTLTETSDGRYYLNK